MSLSVVLILVLQIVFIWLLSPLLIGAVAAVVQRDPKMLLKPYADLRADVRKPNQLALIAWAALMVLVLLVPSISLRAPLDWMADTSFMWVVLLGSQLLLVTKPFKLSIILGNIAWLFMLLSAVFLGGAFHNTVLLSNGIFFSSLALIIGLVLAGLTLVLWSRFIVLPAGKYDFNVWIGSTSLWLLVLWMSSLFFPALLAWNWSGASILVAVGFLLLKFLVAVVILVLAALVHRLLSLRTVLVLQVTVALISAGVFVYLVLA
jgi:hypothetical protein